RNRPLRRTNRQPRAAAPEIRPQSSTSTVAFHYRETWLRVPAVYVCSELEYLRPSIEPETSAAQPFRLLHLLKTHARSQRKNNSGSAGHKCTKDRLRSDC